MKIFYVSYDLKNNGGYEALIDELERLNAKHILESVWSIQTKDDDKYTSEKILNYFKKIIKDTNARIVVIEVIDHFPFNTIEEPYEI